MQWTPYHWDIQGQLAAIASMVPKIAKRPEKTRPLSTNSDRFAWFCHLKMQKKKKKFGPNNARQVVWAQFYFSATPIWFKRHHLIRCFICYSLFLFSSCLLRYTDWEKRCCKRNSNLTGLQKFIMPGLNFLEICLTRIQVHGQVLKRMEQCHGINHKFPIFFAWWMATLHKCNNLALTDNTPWTWSTCSVDV